MSMFNLLLVDCPMALSAALSYVCPQPKNVSAEAISNLMLTCRQCLLSKNARHGLTANERGLAKWGNVVPSAPANRS